MADTSSTLLPLAVSAEELARLIGVSLSHVRRMDASAKLPRPIRLGSAVRWNVATVQKWLDAGCPDRATWEGRP